MQQHFKYGRPGVRLPRRLWVSAGGLLVVLCLGLATLIHPSNVAQAQVYSNSTPITINDGTASGPGTATPYPSTITISNVVGNITKLQVTLTGFSHQSPGDVDMLLVSPSGRSLLLFSNSGGSLDVTNLNFTFDDSATSSLPQSTQLSSGTYKPTQNGNTTATFPGATYNAGPFGTKLSAFNGDSANGQWKLYVVDNSPGSTGSISGGWSLNVNSADISLAKTGSPSPVNAGSNITYNITATNAGPDPAANAIFTDTLPANTSFVSLSSPGGWNCNVPGTGQGGTINCSLPSFGLTNAAFQLVVKVSPTTASGSNIVNSATIASGTPDTVIANNTATFTDTVTTSADLLSSTSGTPSPVTAGTDITYSVTVTNTGPSNALSAVLTDTLPVSTTFKALTIPNGSGWTCPTKPAVGSTGNIVCNNSSFGLTNTTFVVTAHVNPDVLVGSTLTNAVATSSSTPDPNSGNNNSSVTTPVATLADLSVVKTGTPSAVNSGNNINYVITVTNAGPSYAAATTLTDNIPTNTTFQSLGAAPNGWSCMTPAVGATGTVSCNNNADALGATTFSLAVKVNSNTALNTIITNTASVTSSTSDPNSANNTASATSSVGTQADLGILKTASPSPVTPGTPLTYTLAIVNNGPSFATNVVLSDTLPVSTTFRTLTAPGGWTCNNLTPGQGGTLSCTNLSYGLATNYITLTVNVDPALPGSSQITNTATVSATTGDNNQSNNTSTITTLVNPLDDLAVSLSNSPNPVRAGDFLTYSIVVTNTGPSNAASSLMTDTLPVSTTFQSISAPAGWTCSGTSTVSCTNPSVALTTGTFSLVVKVDSAVITGTVLSNSVRVSSGTSDTDSANNTASTSATVRTEADLRVNKTAQSNTTQPGDFINYTITVTNGGPSQALGVVLTDTVPTNTLFQAFTNPAGWSCTTPAQGGIGTISCNTVALGVVTNTFTLQVKVKNTASTGIAINNTVSVATTGTPDPVAANNSSTASVGVNCNTSVVTNNRDDGTCGTLRVALNGGGTVTGSFTTPLTLTFNVNSLPLVMPVGTFLTLPTNANGPLFTIDGAGVLDGNSQPIDGLTLSQNNSVNGLRIIHFSGRQLYAPMGSRSILSHLVLSKV